MAFPSTHSSLPEFLRRYFWAYVFDELRWETDQDLVIGQVVAHGDLEAISWLRQVAGDRRLRTWLRQRRGGGLTPEQLRFWELILGLRHTEVSGWIAQEGRKIWDQRVGA